MSQRLAPAGWLELAVTIGLYIMLGKSSLSPGEPDLLFTLAAGAGVVIRFQNIHLCLYRSDRCAYRHGSDGVGGICIRFAFLGLRYGPNTGPSLALGVCRILPRSG